MVKTPWNLFSQLADVIFFIYILCKKVKPDKKVFPLVLDYNPILPDIQKVIRKHFHLLESSPEVKEIFPSKSIFPAYRRTKNLKEMLAPSKFRVTSL